MGKKIRLLLLVVIAVLFSVFFSLRLMKNIPKALAVPGQLNFGTTETTQLNYVKSATIYQNNLYFGNSANTGILTTQGYLILNSGLKSGDTTYNMPTGFVVDVNGGRVRADGVSIGTTDTDYNLEVNGGVSPYGTAARFQGNVGIGHGVTGPFDVPMTILQPTPGKPAVKVKDFNGKAVGIGGDNGKMVFTTNGDDATVRAVIDTGGNVGIGTVSPVSILEITAADPTAYSMGAASKARIRLNNTDVTNNSFSSLDFASNDGMGTSGLTGRIVGVNTNHTTNNWSGEMQFLTRNGNTFNEAMRINSAGNVGIAQNVPAAKLDVGGVVSTISNNVGNLNIVPSGNLLITQGNVGMGTTNPGAKLDFGGVAFSGTAINVPTNNYISFCGTSGVPNPFYGCGILGTNATNTLLFYAGNGTNSAINAASINLNGLYAGPGLGVGYANTVSLPSNGMIVYGNVGIGTSTPTVKFSVNEKFGFGTTDNAYWSSYTNGGVLIGAGWNGNQMLNAPRSMITWADQGLYGADMIFATRTSAGTAINENLRLAATGNVGIGSSTPTSKLTVVGDTYSNTFTIPQNPVSTVYEGGNLNPPYSIGGIAGDNDFWRIYGESTSTNQGRMVLETGDDVGEGFVFRQHMTYSPYTTRDPLVIDGSGNIGISVMAPLHRFDVSGTAMIGSSPQKVFQTGSWVCPVGGIDLGGGQGAPCFGNGLFVDSGSGNVGVGTPFPKSEFSVSFGNSDMINFYQPSDNQLAIQTTIDGAALLQNYAYADTNYIFRLQPYVGSVVVGQPGLFPYGKLEVSLVNPSGWSGNLKAFRAVSPDTNYWLSLDSAGCANGGVCWTYSTNGGQGLTIGNAGNIGIGTTSPASRFEMYDTNPTFPNQGSVYVGSKGLPGTGTTQYTGAINTILSSDGTNAGTWYATGKLAWMDDRDAGLYANSIAAVGGTIFANRPAGYASYTGMFDGNATLQSPFLMSNSPLKICNTGGGGSCFNNTYNTTLYISYVGGGTQYAIEAKPVANGTQVLAVMNAAGGYVGGVSQSATNTGFNTSSDRRLKENVTPTKLGIETLMKVSVRDFNFITEPNKRLQGFIAQDLYSVYPYAVTKGGDDPKLHPWVVDYGRLTPLIVKSVQDQEEKIIKLTNDGDVISKTLKEQQNQIDELSLKNQDLEKRISKQEEKIQNLEKTIEEVKKELLLIKK